MTEPLKLGVLGIDHRHIFGMLGNMLAAGCSCNQWWTKDATEVEVGFTKRFPNLKRVSNLESILEDQTVKMVLISSTPVDRASLAIRAMEAGKDVMVDKPGCISLSQLQQIRDCVNRTGRIWSVNFSERFEVPAVTLADKLVSDGKIGRVIQTIGIGPHRQNLSTRPNWFFDRSKSGGILCDIGSHQIDQFLYFTGSTNVKISHALVENTTLHEYPNFEDFGEIVLTGDSGHGYIRVDWFTPDALPTWGDGRLFILGTEGSIEIRKYTDLAKSDAGDHLFLVNGDTLKYFDCSTENLPYFPRLIDDVINRTETASSQEHTFRTTELAIRAQNLALENFKNAPNS